MNNNKMMGSCQLENVPHNPELIWIEPTTRCNSRCIHCEHYYRNFGEDMSSKLYHKIKQQLMDDINTVELIGYGEPLIAENFLQMVRDCRKREIQVYTTTNGIALTDKELLKELFINDVNICLSLDGASAETYQFVRPYIKWEKMLTILENIRTFKENLKNCHSRLRINFVPMKNNIKDLPDLVELAHQNHFEEILIFPLGGEKIFDKVRNQGLHDCPHVVYKYFMKALRKAAGYNIHLSVPGAIHNLILRGAVKKNSLSGKINALFTLMECGLLYARQNGFKETARKAKKTFLSRKRKHLVQYCQYPWNASYFSQDGAVFPCCLRGLKMGNLNEQSWQDIWNGYIYRNLRRTVHSWNPTRTCRYCALACGINAGDENHYNHFFKHFKSERIHGDKYTIDYVDGFYLPEKDENRDIEFRWMKKQGKLTITNHPSAKFVRVTIMPLTPGGLVNSGTCIINGKKIHPFDNTCTHLHFPLSRRRKHYFKHELLFNMENSVTPENDGRELSLNITDVHYLI